MDPSEKRQKRENFDFIKRLPDSIIHQIFCLLPIEQVYRASVLSKEWHRSVSTYPFPELRIPISEEDEVAERRVFNFYRDMSLNTKKCRLQIEFTTEESLFCSNRVLGIVADQEKVKQQEVGIIGHPSTVLNGYVGFRRILAVDSLAALELSRCKLNLRRLDVNLPNLKKLCFSDCIFSRRDHVLRKFLHGSPAVEHLSLRSFDFIERVVNKIIIPGENLKYFDCIFRGCYRQTVTMDIQSRVLRAFRFQYSPPSPTPPYFRMQIDLTQHKSLRELKLKRVAFHRHYNQFPVDVVPVVLAGVQELELEDSEFTPWDAAPIPTIFSERLTRLVLSGSLLYLIGVRIVVPNLVSLEYNNHSLFPSNPLSHIIALNLRDIHVKTPMWTNNLSFIASMNLELKKLGIYRHVNIQCFRLPKQCLGEQEQEQEQILMQQKLCEVDWHSLLECVSVAGRSVCISSRTC